MIYVSHGDKGGVGKSMTAAVLVDYLLSTGRKVTLIESDKGQPDVALRYAGLVDIAAVNLNRAGDSEAAVMKWANTIEAIDPASDIVVNLPAAAGDTLDSMADLLVAAAEECGHDMTIMYSLGAYSTAADMLEASLTSGMMASVPFERTCIVYPEFLGKQDAFTFYKTATRTKYLKAGGREVVMPAISPIELVEAVFKSQGSLSALAEKETSSLNFGQRIFFSKKWLPMAHERVAQVVV
jgi:hypothetical protein